jgi:hypothetical protein
MGATMGRISFSRVLEWQRKDRMFGISLSRWLPHDRTDH